MSRRRKSQIPGRGRGNTNWLPPAKQRKPLLSLTERNRRDEAKAEAEREAMFPSPFGDGVMVTESTLFERPPDFLIDWLNSDQRG